MALPLFLHPNRKRLAAWLHRPEAPNDAVTAHVERCERCADRLEEMSTDDTNVGDRLDSEIGMVLREVFAPPAGMHERVMRSIDDRERADRELDLLLGLFAIPSDAATLLLPDDSDGTRDDGRRTGEDEG